MDVGARHRASSAQHLCHPIPLFAVLVLAVNDHLLKGSAVLPGVITGKLSDIAGLFFFPILLAAMLRRVLPVSGKGALTERNLTLGSITATGTVFALLKLSPTFNALVARLGAVNALDPTDLLVLPALGLTWLFLRTVRPLPAREGLQRAAVVAAGLASMATSYVHVSRVYPRWNPVAPARCRLACAEAELWVAKSGKEGAGVTLELRAAEPDCEVHVDQAELRFPSRSVPARSLPPPTVVRRGEPRYVWLAFPFDGDAAWNAGERTATLRLALRSGGKPEDWEVALTSVIDGGHQIKVDESRPRDWSGSP